MKTSVERLTGRGFAICGIHLIRKAVKPRISILAAVVLPFILPAMSFAVTNDFNDGTGHDVIIPTNHYIGLTFNNAAWTTFGGKTLGVDAGVTGGGNNWAFPGTSSPIVIAFDLPANSVSITAIDVGQNGVQLEAFSGASSVGTDNAGGPPGPLTVGLTVNAASIDRIELTQHLINESSPIQDGVVFDDLIYTLAPAVPSGTVLCFK